jgi:mono/diheme cytochrome c family protein
MRLGLPPSAVSPACLLLGLNLLAGCDTATEDTATVSATRVVQRAYTPMPPGTVQRGAAEREAALAAPGPEVTPELIRRGEEQFLAFCSPCHGTEGQGNGPVVVHGFPAPPTYHQERLRALPPQRIVAVITRGTGRMYPYADRVEPQDRWAIAHYVKFLQARNPDEGAATTEVAP